MTKSRSPLLATFAGTLPTRVSSKPGIRTLKQALSEEIYLSSGQSFGYRSHRPSDLPLFPLACGFPSPDDPFMAMRRPIEPSVMAFQRSSRRIENPLTLEVEDWRLSSYMPSGWDTQEAALTVLLHNLADP
ncbi:hypothetical protein [Rhizobium sp. Leaf391]|uniref:hypothetical protein n=1 Tax=Rhizobium sp. Leaf391 TaxID=1736360 RepID=UPI001910A042|nr:hypothetical protein [Rhizobium sp. Leaf391]